MVTISCCVKELSTINPDWYIPYALCKKCGKVYICGEEHVVNTNHPNLKEMTGYELGSKDHEDTLHYQDMLDKWYQCEDNNKDKIIEMGIRNAIHFNPSVMKGYWLRYCRWIDKHPQLKMELIQQALCKYPEVFISLSNIYKEVNKVDV